MNSSPIADTKSEDEGGITITEDSSNTALNIGLNSSIVQTVNDSIETALQENEDEGGTVSIDLDFGGNDEGKYLFLDMIQNQSLFNTSFLRFIISLP